MPADLPPFRGGSELVTRFTGTITERHGDTVERIPTPQRFAEWLADNGLPAASCNEQERLEATGLREAIHVALDAVARGVDIPVGAACTINVHSQGGRAAARLTPQGAREWVLGPPPRVADALAVLAQEAIAILAGERDGRLALCDSPTCREPFFDTSRSRTRRWCDMNICGNKQKKARLKAARSSAARAASDQTSRTAP